MNEWRSALKAPWKQLWEEIGVYQPFSRVSSRKNAYTGRFCLHVNAHPGAPPCLCPLITANASKTKSVLCDRWVRAWSRRFLNYRSKWMRDKTGFHWTNNPLLVFFFFFIFLLIYAWKFWINFWPPLKRLKKKGSRRGLFLGAMSVLPDGRPLPRHKHGETLQNGENIACNHKGHVS